VNVSVPVSVATRLVGLGRWAEPIARRLGVRGHPQVAPLFEAVADLEVARRAAVYGTPPPSLGSAQVPQRPGRDWVSTMTAAAALGITDRAVRKRASNGTLRAARDRRGWWRIDPGELP